MEDNMSIIYEFLEQFQDFTQSDKESGYKNVYRPSWHPNPLQFWFNPPFDVNGKSIPTPSNTISLSPNGRVMVEDIRTGLCYNLDECLGYSVENFAIAIEDYTR